MRYLFLMVIFISLTAHAQDKPDSTRSIDLNEVVVTSSKQEEKLLQSPVSIEKLNLQAIRQSAQPSFFDAIENLKGIHMITPSLGFKVINARGFTNTTNVRFMQMVDGVDNQAPHIGAPIANSLGPNDLDILSVEVMPGSASALYGMNAINGTANFITKDPFVFSGLSIQQKTGVNHIADHQRKASPYSETSIRFAKALNNKFAFKINGTYMRGTDWYADNRTDLSSSINNSTGLTGAQNPGKDQMNIYADESSNRRTLTLGNKQYIISRTGYAEKDATSYALQNYKGDASIFYKPKPTVELSYIYRFAYLNTTYQRTNRFRLEDYLTQQHGLAFKSPGIQIRTYFTSENTGKSYNIRSMAENIDRGYKTDNVWYQDFSNQFNKDVSAGATIPYALNDSRVFADLRRPQPGTTEYAQSISKLRNINNWDLGAALRVKALMYHAEGQHSLTEKIFPALKERYDLDVMYGIDFRNYTIIPDGNYFINPVNPGKNLNYWKTGGFVQLNKFLFAHKIKINGIVRIDKNQYFTPKLNPRIALVYSPKIEHNIRISFQQGYRFPSLFEAFSNINSGGVKRVGGLPVMSSGIFENSYIRSSIDAFQSAVTTDINKNGISKTEAIIKNEAILKHNSYTYLQPEQVRSLEAGYRSSLFNNKLFLDIDGYYNIYKNLIAQVEANIPLTTNPDSISTFLNDRLKQNRYRLWTNSKTISYNYGGSIGSYLLIGKGFKVGGNITQTKLKRRKQSDGLEDGFNTPSWIYNLNISHPGILAKTGFSLNYRWQDQYVWQSSLATGKVQSYATIDFQINHAFSKKISLKIGGTNILNKYYYSFIGGPSIGGFYYANLLYEIF